jgi:hypothetical protein
MTNSLRLFVVALAITAVGACGKDNSTAAGPSVDVLAQDTTLQLGPPLRADQDLGPQDILAVAAPASGTAVEPAASGEQSAAKAPRRAATRNTSLASGPTRSVHTSAGSPRARASRRAVVASSATPRIDTRSRAAGRQTRSTGRVLATRDAGADDASPVTAPITEPVNSTLPRTNRQVVVAAGSELALQAGRRVCTNTANVGDRFEAVLVEQVQGGNGVVIPKGATAVALVSSIQRDKPRSATGIDIQIESITFNGHTYPLSSKVTATELDKVRSNSRGNDLARVAAGTVFGAGMGGVLGRNTRSTVIGAASGAAAGAVLASRSNTFNTCVPDGGRITAELVQPLTIGAAE